MSGLLWLKTAECIAHHDAVITRTRCPRSNVSSPSPGNALALALSVFFLTGLAPGSAATSNVSLTLDWTPSEVSPGQPDLIGYRVHYGTSSRHSGSYDRVKEVGLVSSATLSGLAPNTKYYFAVTVHDERGLESDYSDELAHTTTSVSVQESTGADHLLVDARFDSGTDGFAYRDDVFRGTANPAYASGEWTPWGYRGGGLRVQLGGIDGANIYGMSGGWRLPFRVPNTSRVTLAFRYRMLQSAHYNPNEFSLAMASFNGNPLRQDGANYLARLTGDGNNGPAQTTGWQLFNADLGNLAAGTHTVILGGYNNLKTDRNEMMSVYIDDVVVSAAQASESAANRAAPDEPVSISPTDAAVLFYAPFDSGTDGFIFKDDTFRDTANPAYASGDWSRWGYRGGGLKVQLGGIDDTRVFAMSGGWRLPFRLPKTSRVTVAFRYRMIQADYDSQGFSRAMASVNGVLLGKDGPDFLQQLTGDGKGRSPAQTTGWQLFSADLGKLPAGTHVLILGGYNNLKTIRKELVSVYIDDVVISAE